MNLDEWNIEQYRIKHPKEKAPICPYCNHVSILVNSKLVYGKGYGPIWICFCKDKWAYVGCHKGTHRPLGRLADKKLRMAKNEAHRYFDPLWLSGKMSRNQAYKWLSEKLNIHIVDCHIGMFDLEKCLKVVNLLKTD